VTVSINNFGVSASGVILGAGATAGAANVFLYRDAANTLALRNGVNAQRLSVYSTYTDASNYSRGIFDFQTNAAVLVIGTQGAGTGSAGQVWFFGPSGLELQILAGSVNFLNHVTFNVDNTYDIGQSASAFRPRNVYVGTSVKSPVYASIGSVPTLTLSGGTCAGTVIAGGATAGTVTLTGACVATNTMALTVMPTAPTGYACTATNRTLGVLDLGQTATTTTSATFTFSATTGATDVIQYSCIAY
jgi:hypothetical protein